MSFATEQQLSLTKEQGELYLKGWRVDGEEHGARLTKFDQLANTREDFGLHESSERAWIVAAKWEGRTKAITNTSSRG